MLTCRLCPGPPPSDFDEGKLPVLGHSAAPSLRLDCCTRSIPASFMNTSSTGDGVGARDLYEMRDVRFWRELRSSTQTEKGCKAVGYF